MSSAETAFYFPGPSWNNPRTIMNALMFFDRVALLVPRHVPNKPYEAPGDAGELARKLRDRGLLQIIEPEDVITPTIAGALHHRVRSVVATATQPGRQGESGGQTDEWKTISWTRIGGGVLEGETRQLMRELRQRGFADPSGTDDGLDVRLDGRIRAVIFDELAHLIAAGQSPDDGGALIPMTDQIFLTELAAIAESRNPRSAAIPNTVRSDYEAIGIDLSSVPLDEALRLREEYHKHFKAYRNDLREFSFRLAGRTTAEVNVELAQRRELLVEETKRTARLRQHLGGRPGVVIRCAVAVAAAVAGQVSFGDAATVASVAALVSTGLGEVLQQPATPQRTAFLVASHRQLEQFRAGEAYYLPADRVTKQRVEHQFLELEAMTQGAHA